MRQNECHTTLVFEFPARFLGSKGVEVAVVLQSNVSSLSVFAAKANIGWLYTGHFDFLQHLTLRRKFYDCAFAMPGDK
jgi:hypothetical protein